MKALIFSRLEPFILRFVQIKTEELQAVLLSFSYFFCLLCSYYIIRPIRDEMGIQGGIDNLQWLFTGTLVLMTIAIPLFGWLSSNFPRRKFLPLIYLAFISMLLGFYGLLGESQSSPLIAQAFFIWTSVFNLFIVSVFWSFMTDLYHKEQAQRLFAFIAAGGTLGAIFGPTITAMLVQVIGNRQLLLVSASFLLVAVWCIHQLSCWSDKQVSDKNLSGVAIQSKELTPTKEQIEKDETLHGGVWDGVFLIFRSPYLMGICLFILLLTSLATFLYFMQAQIIRDAFSDASQRTQVFAFIDLLVNVLTLILQLFLTSRLMQWFGLSTVLAIIPFLLFIGFSLLSISPVVTILLIVQVVRRAGNYAIMRPAREMLYVGLSREEKYKAKNIIDTFVYRTGDAISAWIYAAMKSAGIGLSAIAFIAIPLSLLLTGLAYILGKKQK